MWQQICREVVVFIPTFPTVKNYEIWTIFAEVFVKIKVAHFFETRCSLGTNRQLQEIKLHDSFITIHTVQWLRAETPQEARQHQLRTIDRRPLNAINTTLGSASNLPTDLTLTALSSSLKPHAWVGRMHNRSHCYGTRRPEVEAR